MLQPFNRYVRVEPAEKEQKKEDLAFVLPEDYKEPLSPYLLCNVLSVSEDSKFHCKLNIGDRIIVERRMLLTIEIEAETTYLVLENYIYGRFNNETG